MSTFRTEIVELINKILPKDTNYKLIHDIDDTVYSAIYHEQGEEDYLQYRRNFSTEWINFLNDRKEGKVDISTPWVYLRDFKAFNTFSKGKRELEQSMPSIFGRNFIINGKEVGGADLEKELRAILADVTFDR